MVASIDYWIDIVTVVTLTIIYSVHSIESHWQCEIPFKEINKYNLQKSKLFNYRYIVVSFSVSHADVGEGGGVEWISYLTSYVLVHWANIPIHVIKINLSDWFKYYPQQEMVPLPSVYPSSSLGTDPIIRGVHTRTSTSMKNFRRWTPKNP